MSRNGAGTYSLYPGVNPVVTGTTITSAWANNTLNDLASAMTASIANDGQTPILANLPMSTFRHTGVGNAAARTDYAAAGQVQDNTFTWGGTAGGTADALTLTLTPAITAYAAGQGFEFIVGASPNATTTPTLAVNGLAAKTFKRVDGTTIAAGDLPAGMRVRALYDGTNFRLNYISPVAPTFSGNVTVGSVNKMTITAPASASTLAVADGKTFTASNTLTLAGTDGSTLNVGTGGTLGTAAYTAATAYPSVAFTTIAVSGQSNVVADSTSDTLTLANGTGIAITTNAATDTLTITNTLSGVPSNLTLTNPATAATLTLADNSTLATSGAYSTTLTSTGATNVTLPTSGTLAILGANTFTGAQILSDQQFSRAMMLDCGLTKVDKGNSGTSLQTLDYTAGHIQKVTATGNFTIATSNWPPTGNRGVMILQLVNGGAHTITWPTINWVKPDGTTTTTFSTWLAAVTGRTALQTSGIDEFKLESDDAGTTIYGRFA